ncbi:hypothetical protein CEXT_477401 [Caerostris extrusa]|uniref:Ribosomal protein L2 n=1 Tax=Caerostris extrusa TaxID=172846 RepID=A0AAV4RP13_CAEEX|nr:hypothetical protein CEXT_477401 [Caerostris extrusa]
MINDTTAIDRLLLQPSRFFWSVHLITNFSSLHAWETRTPLNARSVHPSGGIGGGRLRSGRNFYGSRARKTIFAEKLR